MRRAHLGRLRPWTSASQQRVRVDHLADWFGIISPRLAQPKAWCRSAVRAALSGRLVLLSFHRLLKGDADPRFAPPDEAAAVKFTFPQKLQHKALRYSGWTDHVQYSARLGKIADPA
jgi:hypothetical protein